MAVSVGVVLVRAGSLKGLHVGVTVQLTHVANPSIHSQWQTAQRCFIERMDLFLHRGTLAWVGKKREVMPVLRCGITDWATWTQRHFLTIPTSTQTPPPSTPLPCPLVSARARGQVLSHGRHNWSNDWQVDTRAKLWLCLPTRHFRGAHCANRNLSCDCVHTEQKEKQETQSSVKVFSPPFLPRTYFVIARQWTVELVRGQWN